ALEQRTDGTQIPRTERVERARAEAHELSVSRRDSVRLSARWDVSLHEHVVVAEDGIPATVEAGGTKRPLRLTQQSRVLRRIDGRAVVEGIGVRGFLHSFVPGATAVGMGAPAVEDGERVVELVLLRVVDQVTGLDDCLRPKLVERRDCGAQHLSRECFLWTKRGREGCAEAVEPLDARG